MKLTIDTAQRTIAIDGPDGPRTVPLYSTEGFSLVSDLWVKIGWNQKYSYTFSWFGRPIIQLPEDMIRVQEAIWEVKPDVIVETGVAHGGSLIYYAALTQAIGRGRVVGIDIEIRPHNRAAIEAHPLARHIQLIEGSSIDDGVLAQVQGAIRPGETVMVLLDSNHSRDHVLAELRAYGPMVTAGSYLVATDGIMRDLTDVPRGQPGWDVDNPAEAVRLFLMETQDFDLVAPPRPFDESALGATPTHWPMAWLKKL